MDIYWQLNQIDIQMCMRMQIWTVCILFEDILIHKEIWKLKEKKEKCIDSIRFDPC
jgi:hypothetical protein